MKQSRIFVILAIMVLMISISACGESVRDRNIRQATDAGYEFAGHYLHDDLSEMERQALLLDVRSREHLLRTEIDGDVADAFIAAFSDSIGAI